jgi:hypothetical protein
MAIKLIANYSKRLGLPGYSSHQFSVSVETELVNLEDVPAESARLYATLQTAVDEQMQQTGFVPPDGYGMNGAASGTSGHNNGNGSARRPQQRDTGISEKQLDLVNRIVRENNLNKTEVENLSVEMFGGGVRSLNRMQASNFIDELFERHPRRANGSGGNGNGRGYPRREEAPV